MNSTGGATLALIAVYDPISRPEGQEHSHQIYLNIDTYVCKHTNRLTDMHTNIHTNKHSVRLKNNHPECDEFLVNLWSTMSQISGIT